jgi:hypothetical protein
MGFSSSLFPCLYPPPPSIYYLKPADNYFVNSIKLELSNNQLGINDFRATISRRNGAPKSASNHRSAQKSAPKTLLPSLFSPVPPADETVSTSGYCRRVNALECLLAPSATN